VNPGATNAVPITPAEANVITGRVTTDLGQPIEGAQIRIVGYTGGANLGREIETVETDASGTYRSEVPSGLYEALGKAALVFDDEVYVFDLEPVDGVCDQQLSEDGIVEGFVLRLTGISPCNIAADPDTYTSYHGAAIQLFDRTSGHSSDAVIEYTLEPTGPLADGGTGETLTMERTIADLQTSAGPIDSTWLLYDIPLARYRVSAALVETDGTRVSLLVSTDTATEPAAEVEVASGARLVLGTPDVGYLVPQVLIHD
jgi:hypothetical protein